jgi:hypothetical protein
VNAGADADRRVEGGNTGAAGAHPLDQDALRHQLDLELTGVDLIVGGRPRTWPPGEGRDEPAHLP